MTKESNIEREFVKYAKLQGCYAPKFTGERGYPDRIVYGPGFLFWIEFKRPGETPEKYQKRIHKRLQDAEQSVYVIDNLDEAKELLNRHLYVEHRMKLKDVEIGQCFAFDGAIFMKLHTLHLRHVCLRHQKEDNGFKIGGVYTFPGKTIVCIIRYALQINEA